MGFDTSTNIKVNGSVIIGPGERAATVSVEKNVFDIERDDKKRVSFGVEAGVVGGVASSSYSDEVFGYHWQQGSDTKLVGAFVRPIVTLHMLTHLPITLAAGPALLHGSGARTFREGDGPVEQRYGSRTALALAVRVGIDYVANDRLTLGAGFSAVEANADVKAGQEYSFREGALDPKLSSMGVAGFELRAAWTF